MGSDRWVAALADAVACEDAVLVSVAAVQGSAPREPGASMVVTRANVSGSIGGGHLEHEAKRLAREALDAWSGAPRWVVRFPLAARLGQCCGGVATLAFSRIPAGTPTWLDAARTCAQADAPFVLVVRVGGGEEASEWLVVTGETVQGSLGEVALDAQAIDAARRRLASADGPARGNAGLVEILEVPLLFMVVPSQPLQIVLFGNGHVGRALAHILGALPVSVHWVDSRADDFPASVAANVECVASDDPVREVARVASGACVVIMTHSHPLDFDIAEAALKRDDLAYVGLIGSRSKRTQFKKRLAARGLAPARLARLVCPIGAGPLTGKEPGVIALAVASELAALREGLGAAQAGADAGAPARGARD